MRSHESEGEEEDERGFDFLLCIYCNELILTFAL